ncbi:MAG: NADP-reducing hydrogenase subunit HndC [Alphaproteobacteria bacterium ADurb.Bin438]|nr:MAG: NADP-reducing hydrogenase subunit HndC [Alphaproteobacteria bacterium ADurb.Bin438]
MQQIRDAKEKGEPIPYHFIEVMACPGGCISGGGQPRTINDDIRKKRTKGLNQDDYNSRRRCSHQNPFIIKLYEEFLGKPCGEKSHKLLHTSYTPRSIYR